MKQITLRRVLLVSGVYPPAIGGPALQTKQIAQYLIAQGLQVHVLTYGDPQGSGILDGVPVTFLEGRPQDSWFGKIYRNLRVYQQLDQVIRQFQPDLLHMQTAAGNLAMIAAIAARWHHLPSLIKYTADLVFQKASLTEFHDLSQPRRPWQTLAQFCTYSFQKLLFSIYDGIWATTPLFQERLVQHYHLPHHKTFLLANFIDLEPFEQVARQRNLTSQDLTRFSGSPQPQAAARIILLTIARLFPVKGLDVYFQAIAQLQDLAIEVRMVGSGSAAYEAYLRRLADDLGIQTRVKWIGAIAPEAVAAEYQTADLFVLPSRHEPFGIVLLEAMAAGLPILATQVDGIPAVVEAGVSAYLVPPNDVASLAAALRFLVLNPDKRQELAIAGQKRVQRFNLRPSLITLMNIYQTLLQASMSRENDAVQPHPNL